MISMISSRTQKKKHNLAIHSQESAINCPTQPLCYLCQNEVEVFCTLTTEQRCQLPVTDVCDQAIWIVMV